MRKRISEVIYIDNRILFPISWLHTYIRSESLGQDKTVLSEEVYNLKTDCMEGHNLHHSGRNEARTFELEAIDELQKFKQLKKMEEVVYEKERAKARLRKLSKR